METIAKSKVFKASDIIAYASGSVVSKVMPADVPHAVNATGKFKMQMTMIRD
ncbi:MAG: hypothetical protein JW723_06020 [Bacteroidales bacterium]|nr:hypothetical protein [Bacteroidales bacterium]